MPSVARINTGLLFARGRNEGKARQGIDTGKLCVLETYTLGLVEMKAKPDRALTQLNNRSLGIGEPPSRNEGKARQGIDTIIECRYDSAVSTVEMKAKPDRALTHCMYIRHKSGLGTVEMKAKPDRALTQQITAIVFLFIKGRNEGKARQGIDTPVCNFLKQDRIEKCKKKRDAAP